MIVLLKIFVLFLIEVAIVYISNPKSELDEKGERLYQRKINSKNGKETTA